jgi:hypothetical protein
MKRNERRPPLVDVTTKTQAHRRRKAAPVPKQDLSALLKELQPEQAASITELWLAGDTEQRRVLQELAYQAASIERQLGRLRSDLMPQIEEVRRLHELVRNQEAIAFIEQMQSEAASRSPEENAALQTEWDEIMKALEGADSGTAPESTAA